MNCSFKYDTARSESPILYITIERSPALSYKTYGPRREKTCLRGVGDNKGADQPAHPRSLISACVARLFESIIYKLDTGRISMF